jgi:hypothetical protein
MKFDRREATQPARTSGALLTQPRQVWPWPMEANEHTFRHRPNGSSEDAAADHSTAAQIAIGLEARTLPALAGRASEDHHSADRLA